MRIFDESEAQYYCSGYSASMGKAQSSVRTFCRQELVGVNTLTEGSREFNDFRDCSLRSVERHLFLAASQYKFSHELMLAGAISWAYVSVYYGSFYSARALLSMFGGWVDGNEVIIEVEKGNIKQQELKIHHLSKKNKNLTAFTTYSGPHQIFWDLFYKSMITLHPWIQEPELLVGITPVSSNHAWQIYNRNEINYDSCKALDLAKDFMAVFQPHQFPDTLPGLLNTQFKISEAIMTLAFRYAKVFNINTDALSILLPAVQRGHVIDKFIFQVQSGVSVSPKLKAILIN